MLILHLTPVICSVQFGSRWSVWSLCWLLLVRVLSSSCGIILYGNCVLQEHRNRRIPLTKTSHLVRFFYSNLFIWSFYTMPTNPHQSPYLVMTFWVPLDKDFRPSHVSQAYANILPISLDPFLFLCVDKAFMKKTSGTSYFKHK